MVDKKKDNQTVSANKLLDRVPETNYLREWTELVQKEKPKREVSEQHSVVIFRLSYEWLALSTQAFAEVIRKRSIHTVPYRTNRIFLGCVNFRGQLWLAGSLHTVLEIAAKEELEHKYQRMLAICKGSEQWVLPVDEVYGVHRYDVKELQNVPVTVEKSTASYIKGIITWEGKPVAVLDDELLFYSLRRSIS